MIKESTLRREARHETLTEEQLVRMVKAKCKWESDKRAQGILPPPGPRPSPAMIRVQKKYRIYKTY